jgi:hypothetical protein
MKKNELDQTDRDVAQSESKARRPYSPPRIEKRQPVARVTLLSGMGAMSVGVISMMN